MNMQKHKNALLKQLDNGKQEQKKIDETCSGFWELKRNVGNYFVF